MDSKEFFESWKNILGFAEGMFCSCRLPDTWTVKFRSENDLEWPWILTFSKLEWTFRREKCEFNDLLENFVKDLEESIKRSNFTFYVENEKTGERRMVCENPRSLEEMLIQSELNFGKWEKAEDEEG